MDVARWRGGDWSEEKNYMQVRAFGELCLERRHIVLGQMLKIDARDQMIEVMQETTASV
jgi:hypothetical protein